MCFAGHRLGGSKPTLCLQLQGELALSWASDCVSVHRVGMVGGLGPFLLWLFLPAP